MRASTKRILSIGIALVFFIGAVVVYQNLIGPEGAVIMEKRGIVTAKANLFEGQQQAVTEVQGLISQFQNLKSLQESVSLSMPDGQKTTLALSQIEAIARSSNVTIVSLDFRSLTARPSEQQLIKKLGTLEVKLGLVGAYNDLKNFLRLLETNVRVANVKELNFARAQQDYNLNIMAEMYYQED